VLYDFSADAQNLVNVMKGIQPTTSTGMARADRALSPALAEGLSAFARGVQQEERAFDARVRAEQTLFALEDMADRLAGVPGRKNVVWVSSHFPFLFASKDIPVPSAHYMTPETRRVARALNDIDTAVYPVDVRGLIATAPYDPSKVARLRNVEETITGLRMLSEWTGGRIFYNTNDLAASAAQAVEGSRFSYVLGYYPFAGEWDGRFRRIEVKVARPGVNVRHRSGYYAFALTPAEPATRQKALTDALKKPLEATGVLMNVSARRVEGGIRLAIELGPGTVTLTSDQGTWKGGIDVAIAQTLPEDRQIREPDFSMPLSLTAAERDRIVKQGVRLTRTINLSSDARQVRIVVRDAATGAIGSLIIEADRLRRAAERRETISAAR
jgi:VWFA-related protein